MRGSERSLVRHPPAPRRGRSRGRRSVPSKALCRGRADLEWTGRQRPPPPGTGGEWPLSYRPALTPHPGLALPAQRVGKILDVEGMAQRIVDMNASGGGRPVRGSRSRDVTSQTRTPAAPGADGTAARRSSRRPTRSPSAKQSSTQSCGGDRHSGGLRTLRRWTPPYQPSLPGPPKSGTT